MVREAGPRRKFSLCTAVKDFQGRRSAVDRRCAATRVNLTDDYVDDEKEAGRKGLRAYARASRPFA
jgi:hypothetical protein